MLKVCDRCHRAKDENGNPVGDPLPFEQQQTHGTCSKCEAAFLSTPQAQGLIGLALSTPREQELISASRCAQLLGVAEK